MQTLIILIFGEVLPKIWIVAPHISVSISLMDNSPKYLGSWVHYPKETQFIFDPTILDNNGDRILTTLISGSIIRLSSMVSAGVSTDRPRCCKKSSCPKITSIALLPLHMTLCLVGPMCNIWSGEQNLLTLERKIYINTYSYLNLVFILLNLKMNASFLQKFEKNVILMILIYLGKWCRYPIEQVT